MRTAPSRHVAGLIWVLGLIVLLIFGNAVPASATQDQPVETLSIRSLLRAGMPVGTTITWLTKWTGPLSDSLRYRFSVQRSGSSPGIVQDFGPKSYFTWTPMEEGNYTIVVSLEDTATGQSWMAQSSYDVTSHVSGRTPVVTATAHPLVLLYSAPPCDSGSMRVMFRPHGSPEAPWTHTNWRPCRLGLSMNFYVAGLLSTTTYEIHHEMDDGSIGPALEMSTREPQVQFPSFTVVTPPAPQSSQEDGVVLHAINGGTYELVFPIATDRAGQVIWYYKYRSFENPEFPGNAGQYLVRPVAGGTMLMFLNYGGEFDQVLREINLVGSPILETNVEQINRQLQAMGQDPISYFSHEAVRLPSGHTLVLGTVERLLPGVQGPGPADVLGDMVIDLDENFQVTWTWNALDDLDVSRPAVLGEICTILTVGCPPLSLALRANDWTHANAIDYLPSDGNLLISLRNQDWVIKIDYRDGQGTGDVIWRLGAGGDFAVEAGVPDPWFSHPHHAVYDGQHLALFDNGNTRCDGNPEGCNSRGQVWQIDEASRVATLVENVDLGGYSEAFGSAQHLSNGNYHFLSGLLIPGIVSDSIEFSPDGVEVYRLRAQGTTYRSFRMKDLYTP